MGSPVVSQFWCLRPAPSRDASDFKSRVVATDSRLGVCMYTSQTQRIPDIPASSEHPRKQNLKEYVLRPRCPKPWVDFWGRRGC